MFNAEQDQKIDALVRELTPSIHEKLAGLAAEFTSDELATQYQGIDGESMECVQTRVYVSMETSLAREMVSRLVVNLINPHITAQ